MSDLPIPVWDLYKSIKPDEIGWTEPVLLKLSESHSAAFYVALLHLWSVGRPSTCLPRLSSSSPLPSGFRVAKAKYETAAKKVRRKRSNIHCIRSPSSQTNRTTARSSSSSSSERALLPVRRLRSNPISRVAIAAAHSVARRWRHLSVSSPPQPAL